MFYFVRTPGWIKKLFKACVWEIKDTRKVIYLSFDDGPDPEITPFVLDELDKYDAKATFFCIGKNADAQPELTRRIINEGHALGNHTYDHLNGWKTDGRVYLDNILKAGKIINTVLFRPPYGRITNKTVKVITAQPYGFKVIMWSVLSGDFDNSISPEKCFVNIIKNAGSGSIVVFHDSKKADIRMRYSLPRVLKYFSEQGFTFEKITVK